MPKQTSRWGENENIFNNRKGKSLKSYNRTTETKINAFVHSNNKAAAEMDVKGESKRIECRVFNINSDNTKPYFCSYHYSSQMLNM